MVDYQKILSVVMSLIQNSQPVLAGARNAVDLAKELIETIRKPDSEITDADLDRLAGKSDAMHVEVQKPIEG